MSEEQIKDLLIRELVKACKNLGAKSDLLGTICSYGETLDDEFVLNELRHWNSFGKVRPDTKSCEIVGHRDYIPGGADGRSGPIF
jgi:hypothetical protein